MTKWIFPIVALATLPFGTLLAQDITGNWQGKLVLPQPPNEMRVLFKISKGDGGVLKATLYTVDQPNPGFPSSAVTLQGGNVKITIPSIGGTYEGKLDSDAITLTGNWTVGEKPLPLTLAHVKDDAAWEIPKPPPPPKMMPADADPAFEVVTVKPSVPGRPGKAFQSTRTEVRSVNTSVADLMVFAYGVHPRQISGGPGWVESDKYDLEGKPEGGVPNNKQFRVMLQKLLADRFQLKFHHDKKELTVYALTVGKNGPKLTKNDSGGASPALFFRGLGNLPARNATMEEFAGAMQSAVLDRPVVDHTGLEGRFDFQLQWTPDETQFLDLRPPGAPPAPPPGTEVFPDLFSAIQQQLGLKLESAKAQIDVLVIDKIERPSEN